MRDRSESDDRFNRIAEEHLDVVREACADFAFQNAIHRASTLVVDTFSDGGTVYLCGNGGSAADAQHIAAEFSGRFEDDREPLPAVALTTNTSSLTAIGNDYGYDTVFERQVRAYGSEEDLLIGISTSGTSENVLLALDAAEGIGMKTLGLTGRDGGKLASIADHAICVPSDRTARIQEVHIMIGHVIAGAVEAWLINEAETQTKTGRVR